MYKWAQTHSPAHSFGLFENKRIELFDSRRRNRLRPPMLVEFSVGENTAQIQRSSFVTRKPRASADGGYGRGIPAMIWGTGPKATVAGFRLLRRVGDIFVTDYRRRKLQIRGLFHAKSSAWHDYFPRRSHASLTR